MCYSKSRGYTGPSTLMDSAPKVTQSHPKSRWIRLAVALTIFLSCVVCVLFIAPRLVKIPSTFFLQANINSTDSFYDEESGAFSGEVPSQTHFSYAVESAKGDILQIKNILDVRKPNGEKIFSVEPLYGVNALTGAHDLNSGDENRTGYLFAPMYLQKQDFVYWHINYDAPAIMKSDLTHNTVLSTKETL